jgi:uncharacterized protein YndB with AHSA1/START domain
VGDVNSDSDLIDDREFLAPPALVFEAWTKAEHFARWFAPHGVTVPFCEIDARAGGEIRFDHQSSSHRISIKGVFDEVIAPHRLRFTFTFVDADGQPTAPPPVPDWPLGAHIVMTVELQPTRRGTRMIVRQHVLESALAGLPSTKRHHDMAGDGWRETAERLVAYLEGWSWQ